MMQQRPVFLNLMQIKFPVTAICSIFHRISGVLLFLLLAPVLYVLQQSLASPSSFASLSAHLHLTTSWLAFALWVWLSAAAYHLLAGIRHMLMDLGFAEHLAAARVSAWLLLLLAGLLTLCAGVCLW